jgi:uncharacterized protein with FMN-binding domain
VKLLNKVTAFVLILCMILTLAGCGGSKKGYTPGTYSAAAKGFGGDVTVTITVEGNKITKASVEGSKETPNVGGQAFKKLSESIVSKQSAEIDVVSGATVTSKAAIEAAKSAFAKAKGESK